MVATGSGRGGWPPPKGSIWDGNLRPLGLVQEPMSGFFFDSKHDSRADGAASTPARALRVAGAGLLACACLLRPAPAIARAPLELASVELGLGGVAKVGYWTPVRLVFRQPLQQHVHVVVESQDGDASPIRYTGQTLHPEPGRDAYFVYVKLGRPRARVVLRLQDPRTGTVLASHEIRPRAEASSVTWILQIGPPIGIERLVPYGSRSRHRRVVTVSIGAGELDQLPDRWIGYDGVQQIFLTTGDPTWFAALRPAQREALARWVESGGRIILSMGRHARDLFEKHGFPDAWRPGKIRGVERRMETTGLLHYTRASQRLPNRVDASFAVVDAPRGRVLAYEGAGGVGDRPLVTEHPVAFGTVLAVLTDLDDGPLASWLGLPRLMATLSRLYRTDPRHHEAASSTALARVGYTDLIGQLRAALDQFRGVTLARFSWVAAIILLYVLWIGPLDYFGLRWIGRPRATVPAVVPATTIGKVIHVALSQAVKSQSVRLNLLEVLDVDVASGRFRGTAWCHVYSPTRGRWHVAAPWRGDTVCGTNVEEHWAAWQGLPGTGMGALRGPAGGVVRSAPYTVRLLWDGAPASGAIPSLTRWPVFVSSSRSLLVRRFGTVRQDRWTGTARLRATRRKLLQGEIRNPLPVALDHVRIIHGPWVYRLSAGLQPGQRVRLSELRPRDFYWYLTRRRVVGGHDVHEPWDVEATDNLPRIAEILMFHEAAGSTEYTRLDHLYQGWIDLSHHAKLGRAILVGRLRDPLTEVRIDDRALDADRRHAVVRVLLPVELDTEKTDG